MRNINTYGKYYDYILRFHFLIFHLADGKHVKANPNTLISQFYGLHRVKSRGRKAYLVVINNVFPASKDIHQTFDLKVSRYCGVADGRDRPLVGISMKK